MTTDSNPNDSTSDAERVHLRRTIVGVLVVQVLTLLLLWLLQSGYGRT